MAIGPDYSVRPYADKYARDETPVSESDLRSIQKMADNVDSKKWGIDTRYSISSSMRLMDEVIKDTLGRQDEVESQFQDVIENTTDKDVISAPEIIAARDGEANLKARLDKEHQKVTAQLAQIAINVLNPPGNLVPAVGDGISDDAEAVQAIIDYAIDNNMNVLFPPTTYLISSVELYPGISYLGYGATIKRPDMMGKWDKTFSAYYSGDVDSNLMTIKGFKFDGNRLNQGPYDKYELEQAHMIFLDADPSKRGRLRSVIEDCVFVDGVADAISIYRNQDCKVIKCFAENVFRGGVVLTGGYSKLQVSQFTATGDVHKTGFDVEVDGSGFGDSFKTDITLENLIIDGDFDIAVRDNSYVNINNVQSSSSPIYVNGRDSVLKITDCTLHVGVHSSTSNRILFPKNTTFTNCVFVVHRSSDDPENSIYSAMHIFFNISTTSRDKQTINLVNCSFEVDESILETDTTHAIYVEPTRFEGNVLNVINCDISNDFDFGITIEQGLPIANVEGGKNNAKTAFRVSSTETYPLNLNLKNFEVGEDVEVYMRFYSIAYASTIKHQNVVIENGNNVIEGGIGRYVFKGARLIYGENPPTESVVPGFEGDIFRLEIPEAGNVYEWINVERSITSGTWKPTITIGS